MARLGLGGSLIPAAAAAALWLLVFSAFVTFGFFYTTTFTRWFNVRATDLITWRSTLILQYNFANATTGKATPLLSGPLSFLLIWQWCGTLAAALGAAGLLWLSQSSRTGSTALQHPEPAANTTLSNPSGPSSRSSSGTRRTRARRMSHIVRAARKAATRATRLLRLRLPPRGLWHALLGPGGLSLLDLLLILMWLGLHIMWMYEMTMRTLDNRRLAPPPPKVAATAKKAPPPMLAAALPSPLPGAQPLVLPAATTSPGALVGSPAVSSVPIATGGAPSGIVRRLLQQQQSTPDRNTAAGTPPPSASARAPVTAPAPAASAPAAKKLKPLPEVVQDSVSKYLGQVGRWDLLLLFFPLPRCNFLHWLMGSDFAALVKYHRWLGHGTLLVYSLHGIIYMATWSEAGTLSTMLNWGMDAGVNRLAGLVAMCGGWLLWVTALPAIRRRLFNLFYASHITGAVVFLLFGFMHRKDVATYIMPGIFLYLLDVVLRTIQQNYNSTRVSAVASGSGQAAAKIAEDGGVLTLTLECDQSLRWCGSDTVFLNSPAISWWQWHPFTLACAGSAPPAPEGDSRTTSGLPAGNDGSSRTSSGNPMVLHIKKYNRWTRRFIARLATDATPVRLYVSGPYGSANSAWLHGFQRHIFIAGGIGVTPVLGMLLELTQRRGAEAAAAASGSDAGKGGGGGCGGRVSFIWISRSVHELRILPPEVLKEANRGKDGWLDLQLYLTSPSGAASSSFDNIMPKTLLAAVPAVAVSGAPTATGNASTDAVVRSGSTSVGSSSPLSKVAAGTVKAAVAVGASSTTDPRGTAASASAGTDKGAQGGTASLPAAAGCVLSCGPVACGSDHGTSTRPLSHPYMFSPLLWMMAAVLCFAGGFAGLMCAQAYDAHMSRTVPFRKDFSYVGMLQFAALGLGATLPPAVLMWIIHAIRHSAVRRSARVAASNQDHEPEAAFPTTCQSLTTKQPTIATAAADQMDKAPSSDDSQSSVEAKRLAVAATAAGGCDPDASGVKLEAFLLAGRPDLKALLTQLAACDDTGLPRDLDDDGIAAGEGGRGWPLHDGEPCVGVFAAGPAGMVGAVEDICADLNGWWGRRGRAYLQVHTLTHEL